MNILLLGATGFIGSAIAERLLRDGHYLRVAVREPARAKANWPEADCVRLDFERATTPAAWVALVSGMHGVINAAGIVRETKQQKFDVVHVRAPIALFEAA